MDEGVPIPNGPTGGASTVSPGAFAAHARGARGLTPLFVLIDGMHYVMIQVLRPVRCRNPRDGTTIEVSGG